MANLKKSNFRFFPLTFMLVMFVPACRSDQKLFFPEDHQSTGGTDSETSLFALLQNSPNPFSSSTLIRFELKKTLVVTLRVSFPSHTIILFSGFKEGPATHYIVYEPDPNLPNGTYRYALEVNGVYQQRAMTLQR